MVVHQSGVTIKEAARIIGISEAAVRQRLLRRTLTSTRQNGRVFILLPEDTSGGTVDDTIPPPDDTADVPLVMQLREEIGFLRGQVDIKDRQISELHVMLQTVQRLIPATVPDAPHPPEQSGDSGSPPEQEQMPQRGAQRESEAAWRVRLRRWLGWE